MDAAISPGKPPDTLRWFYTSRQGPDTKTLSPRSAEGSQPNHPPQGLALRAGMGAPHQMLS